jgi:hypothetical protein
MSMGELVTKLSRGYGEETQGGNTSGASICRSQGAVTTCFGTKCGRGVAEAYRHTPAIITEWSAGSRAAVLYRADATSQGLAPIRHRRLASRICLGA